MTEDGIPSLSGLKAQERMKKPVDDEGTLDAVVMPEEIELKRTDAEEELAIVERAGKVDHQPAPPRRQRVRFCRRYYDAEALDTSVNPPKKGKWRSELLNNVPMGTENFQTGHIMQIIIDGVKFLNREKLENPIIRDSLREDARIASTDGMDRRRKTKAECHTEDRSRLVVTFPLNLNPNEIAFIQWEGYTFWHEGWLHYDGWTARDRRVLNKDARGTIGV